MINVLNEEIIQHIAAGEVVERPYSVVKELVENAIDGKATRISVDLVDGGKESILVADNGVGMSKVDLEKSWLRHATSKITNLEDMFAVKTMGFRGEALSSIAMVSRMKITTSDNLDGVGYQIQVSENTYLQEVESVGRAKGTTVIVDNLFYNTLPRKKHLKSNATEFGLIQQLLVKYSLIFPNISFSLIHNGKEYLSTSGRGSLLRLCYDLYNIKSEKNLIPIEFEEGSIKIDGLLSNVHASRKDKKHQTISINGRLIKNELLYRVVEEAVRKYMPPATYPQFILNIQLDSKEIDVNAHPRKETIKISIEEELASKLKEVIAFSLKEDRKEELVENTAIRESLTDTPDVSEVKIIGQLEDTYILSQINNRLLIVDQHAAHESILFDKMKESFRETGSYNIESVALEKSIVLNLSPKETTSLIQHLDVFESLGFNFEGFGDNTFILREIPVGFNLKNLDSLIKEILSSPSKAFEWQENLLATISCKTAIKAYEVLSEEVMLELVKEMLERQLTNCPHGRPLFISNPIYELHKQFKRIV